MRSRSGPAGCRTPRRTSAPSRCPPRSSDRSRFVSGAHYFETADGLQACEAGTGLQALEDLAGLIEERTGLVGSAEAAEPLAVLEQRDRHPEGHGKLPEQADGCLEALLDAIGLPAGESQSGPPPVRVCLQ